MRNRLIGVMAALILAITGLTTTAPAAQADINYTTPWKCVNERNIVTCVYVDWHKQADGDGVRLEGFEVWTSRGCGDLENSGGKYNGVTPFFYNPRTEHIDYSYDFGEEPCNFYKDLSNAGSDKGAMDFRFVAKARVNAAGDHRVYIGWTLRPNGTYEVLYAFANNVL